MGKKTKREQAADALEATDAVEAPETAEAREPAASEGVGDDPGGLEAMPTLEAEVERLSEELEELRDRHLRLAAEYDNFRKRTLKERAEARARSQADLVRALVDELDDLDRVVQIDPAQAAAADVLEGVKLVEKKIWRQLEAAGLERLGAVGDTFDPNLHEAVGSMPTPAPEDDHTVAVVMQPGYRLAGHLVRPARVQVYVHADDAEPGGDGSEERTDERDGER